MYKNYLKIALRNLLKNKGYSFINIGGLAVGMAVAILIGLWIYDELTYDKNNQNYERIALVMQNQTIDGNIETWSSQSYQLGQELRETHGSHFKHVVVSTSGKSILTFNEKSFSERGDFMDAEAPDLLSLNMIKGNRNDLNGPNTIFLSESAAQKLFDDSDPLGQVLKMDNQFDVKVTGVYEDLQRNSSFNETHFIAPLDLLVKGDNVTMSLGWINNYFEVLVSLADHVDMEIASVAIKNAKLNNVNEGIARYNPELFLHPMKDWHLYSDFENGKSVGGRIDYVWLFGIIGVFVLLLACINFMNLSTARSEKRAKEVGIRKVIGSVRSQLVSQFYCESLLVTAIGFVLSLLIVQLSLPLLNEVADKRLMILWASPQFWLIAGSFTIITAVIAGSYPALFLSSFTPVKVLKGSVRNGRFASVPRKVLVIMQFTVSVALIIGTMIVYQQIQHAKNRPIGYDLNGLLSIPMKIDEVKSNYEVLRNELLSTGAISEVSKSECMITDIWWSDTGHEWKGKDPEMQDFVYRGAISPEFGKTVGWKIIEGRDFSNEYASDSSGIILNESAVKYMGLDDPIGENIKAYGRDYTVIGVVEDMVSQSLYHPAKQTIFLIDPFNRYEYINVKINPQISAGKALEEIESIFGKYHPSHPFEYEFADNEFASKYAFEERIGKMAGFFAVLAIFISCLGLFGLASFVAEQRTKEIGVRKVLGASVANLWAMLSKEFVVLVLISCFIAIPIAWYYVQGWLQDFEYRIEISWWVFATTGLGALTITLLTVSFQSIKAALMNPVKSLRSE